MIVVVDKQVVKHLVETGDGLLEIPALIEQLRFAGHASGSVELFPATPEPEAPQLILPGEE